MSENLPNLTKREIVLEIYEKTGFPQKEVVATVQMTLDIIMRALAEGRNVELRNFGVLEVQRRKSRIGRNPNKPEAEVVIPRAGRGQVQVGQDSEADAEEARYPETDLSAARAFVSPRPGL